MIYTEKIAETMRMLSADKRKAETFDPVKVKRLFLLALLVFIIACFANPVAAGFGEWKLRNPSGTSIHIQGLAYGKGVYVGYTLEGYVYSSDLIEWHRAITRTPYSVERTKLLNGTFYGFPGSPVYSSIDGISWQEEAMPFSCTIRDIAFGKSILVAVGDDGILVADQGKAWSRVENLHAKGLTGVSYGNGVFVAVGKDGTVLTSENGVEWVSVDLGINDNFTSIAFGNGRFAAATELQTRTGNKISVGPYRTTTSSDGFSWTAPVEYKGNMSSMIWKNGRFWGASASRIYSSSDGVTWKTQLVDLKLGIGRIVDGGDVLIGIGNGLLTSDDGESWKPVVSGTTSSLRSVTFAKGSYVAVGADGTIVTSRDGRIWKEQQVRFNGFADSLHTVLETNGKLVAVGPNSFFSSNDGVKWTQESKPPYPSFAVAKGKDALVAVCTHGKILRSADLKNWTVIDTGTTEQITAVAYNSGIFLAIGGNNILLTSEDEGRNWKVRRSERDLVLPRLCYGNGMFLLAANDRGYYGAQHLYSSEDGVTWHEVRSEEIPQSIQSLNVAEGSFIATTTGSRIYSSYDGRLWTASDSKILGGFRAIAYGNGSYIAVGNNGRIVQAESVR